MAQKPWGLVSAAMTNVYLKEKEYEACVAHMTEESIRGFLAMAVATKGIITLKGNFHAHPLHDFCAYLSHDDTEKMDEFVELTKPGAVGESLLHDDILTMVDTYGFTPCQHLRDKPQNFRYLLTPKWRPATHFAHLRFDREVIRTIITLMYVDNTVWTMMPKELTYQIIAMMFHH